MTSSSDKATKKIPKFPSSSKPKKYYSPSHLKQLRTLSREPWIFTTQKIHENLNRIFKQFELKPIDIEALIYLTLQAFDVNPLTYEAMYKIIRQQIVDRYMIQQGSHIPRQDVSMRRVIVYHTKEKK